MKDTLQLSNGRKEIVQGPTEGKWFLVNPLAIDQTLFIEEREDLWQESARKLILEAFQELKENPKYAKPFKTMILKKTWLMTSVKELEELAESLGDHNADWVEQALEWAQRICNGETWEDLCNKTDPIKYHRLIKWKNDCFQFVGGSYNSNINKGAVKVYYNIYFKIHNCNNVVPLVVDYDD